MRKAGIIPIVVSMLSSIALAAKCPKCDKEALLGSNFCTECGTELVEADKQRQATTAPKPASRPVRATAEVMAKFKASSKRGRAS